MQSSLKLRNIFQNESSAKSDADPVCWQQPRQEHETSSTNCRCIHDTSARCHGNLSIATRSADTQSPSTDRNMRSNNNEGDF